MSDEWISSCKALEVVSSIMPAEAAAEAISSRAHDGLIRSRARRFISEGAPQDDCEIPSEFWRDRGMYPLFQHWPTGDFRARINRADWRAYGVEFYQSDIQQMLPPPTPSAGLERSGPGNYAAAGKCLNELRTRLGCDEGEAEKLILRNCRARLIHARCAKIWWRTTDRYGSSDREDINVEIPDWFWEDCLEDQATVLNWETGVFAGRGIVDDDDCKVRMSGVEFQVGDIVNLQAIELPKRRTSGKAQLIEPSEATAMHKPRPLRPPNERWCIWIAELVAHVHDKGFPPGQGSQGQEQLIKAVANALAQRGEEGLGRTTVQPVVQAVLDRLRPAED